MRIITLLILVFLCGCEKTHCYECVGTQEVTLNVEVAGYPQTTIKKTGICDKTEEEIRDWERENTSVETTYYQDIILETSIDWSCE